MHNEVSWEEFRELQKRLTRLIQFLGLEEARCPSVRHGSCSMLCECFGTTTLLRRPPTFTPTPEILDALRRLPQPSDTDDDIDLTDDDIDLTD